MNTPAHVVLGALALGRGRWSDRWGAISLGAVLPDLPMVAFYVLHRFGLGSSERWIWSEGYFAPGWQALFDGFHSLPLLTLGALVAWRAGRTGSVALLASMMLHALADLPLHHEDAHAHFYPLSSWRFRSPVSYWDPHHHGWVFAAAEGLFVVVGTAVLVASGRTRAWRLVGAASLAAWLALAAFAVLVWGAGPALG